MASLPSVKTPPSTPTSPSTLNRSKYPSPDIQLGKQIGKGASSTVFKAILDKNGEQYECAVKATMAFEKDKRDQILNDLRAFFSGCNCPNMVG